MADGDALAVDLIAQKRADFERDGYVVFERAIAEDLIARFWSEVERELDNNPRLRLSVGSRVFENRERGRGDINALNWRVIDIERYAPSAMALALHPTATAFLRALYGAAPTCIQTLTFARGSEQSPHADKFLVTPGTVGFGYDRDSLVASWIACEPSDEANGALVLYPGSHKIERERPEEGAAASKYSRYLAGLCAQRDIAPTPFYAATGDLLFWHADLVHAGGAIADRARTRRSLVSHYANVSRFRRIPEKGRKRKTFGGGRYFA